MKKRILTLFTIVLVVVFFVFPLSAVAGRAKASPRPSQASGNQRVQGTHQAAPLRPSGSAGSLSGPHPAPGGTGLKERPRPVVTPTGDSPARVGGTATQAAAAGNLKIDWLSINGGGEIAVSSSNYRLGLSVGQTVAGEVSSPSYNMGIGFWYGALPAGSTCDCPHHGDPDASGAIDAIDVQWMIDVVFNGLAPTTDPNCPTVRSDVNCDNSPDATDIQWLIDFVFLGGLPPCNPCGPAPQARR